MLMSMYELNGSGDSCLVTLQIQRKNSDPIFIKGLVEQDLHVLLGTVQAALEEFINKTADFRLMLTAEQFENFDPDDVPYAHLINIDSYHPEGVALCKHRPQMGVWDDGQIVGLSGQQVIQMIDNQSNTNRVCGQCADKFNRKFRRKIEIEMESDE